MILHRLKRFCIVWIEFVTFESIVQRLNRICNVWIECESFESNLYRLNRICININHFSKKIKNLNFCAKILDFFKFSRFCILCRSCTPIFIVIGLSDENKYLNLNFRANGVIFQILIVAIISPVFLVFFDTPFAAVGRTPRDFFWHIKKNRGGCTLRRLLLGVVLQGPSPNLVKPW